MRHISSPSLAFLFHLWGVLTLLLFAGLAASRPAYALTPTPTPQAKEQAQPTAQHTLEAVRFGLPEVLRLNGALDEFTFSLPVPEGWQPQALHMEVSLPPTVEDGFLVVEQDGQVLGTYPLPEGQGPLSISLEHARVKEGRLTLRLRSLLDPLKPFCAPALERWVEVRRLRAIYTGALQPPTTVAAFWPPDLHTLRISIPPQPDAPTATAALTLAAWAARLGSGHGVRVEITAVDPSQPLVVAPAEPFGRTVVLHPAVHTEVALVPPTQPDAWPVLMLSAPPETLPDLVARLAYDAQALIQAPRARVESFEPPKTPNLLRRTFADMGLHRLSMQGSGVLESRFTFSQGDFGGPIADLTLHLKGTYTPVPPGGTATLTVLLNDGLVYAAPLGDAGHFQHTISLPSPRLRRDNTLTVRVMYTPPGGDCRVGVHDLMVHLDPASTLEAKPGQTLPPGFQRFPQVLLPTFMVTFDPLDIDTLQTAATLVSALQRLTTTPLRPRVLPWEEALNQDAALLVVTQHSRKIAALRPPLEPLPFRILDADGREILQLRTDMPFATLQAFEHQGRDVLLWTHRNFPESGRQLERYLHDRDGWYDLRGDVWLWPKGEKPVSFRLRESGLQVHTLPEPPSFWTLRNRLLLFVVLLVMAFMLLLWLYPRLVQRQNRHE